jgi:hypothetical protein
MISDIFRFFLLTLCLFGFIAISQPALAQSEEGFLRKWFPILFGEDREPGPEDTLVAPFAEDQQQKILENQESPPRLGGAEKPLDRSHITFRELEAWIVKKTSTGMSFDDETFEMTVTSLKPFFSQNALQEYINFLSQQGIYAPVLEEGKSLHSVISELPSLTYWDETCPHLASEFLHDDRYHWRFDLQVVYAIKDKDSTNYDAIDQRPGDTVTIQIIVGRVPYSDNPDGLKIHSWRKAQRC